ncbi:MAG: transporter substrate-binding domain-containing protein [Kiritimatiellae bacterium]|nr:transporter substrate-binding domain-containing protein [Kiritimatiellia bacterium]
MKRILPVFLLPILLFALVSCSKRETENQPAKESVAPLAVKPLVVGMELAYPPFEMTDPQGKPAGISVDLAQGIADYLGRPLRIENIPFDGLIPALKTGNIDLIISSMTATWEREQSIDFSDRYLRTGLALLCATNSTIGGMRNQSEGEGRTFAVKLGTTGELYARERLPAATLHVLKDESACVLEVIQGKVDAFIYDQMSVYRNWERNKETTRPMLEAFQMEDWAVGVRKGNDELRGKVNEFLAEFQRNGGFNELGEKYLADMKRVFEQLGYDFIF